MKIQNKYQVVKIVTHFSYQLPRESLNFATIGAGIFWENALFNKSETFDRVGPKLTECEAGRD